MITEAVLSGLSHVGAFLLGLVPSLSLPSWFTDVGTFITNGLTSAAAFGNLLPVGPLRLVFVFLMACLSAGFVIRVTRIVISMFTGGGGSAA